MRKRCRRLRSRRPSSCCVLQAVAEAEGLTVSDEEIEKDLEEKAADYGYESTDAYKEALGSELKATANI